MHSRFTENEGALSIRIRGNTYKHCQACGLQLRGDPKRRAAHYRRYHRGLDPAWLGFEEPPSKGCYANFETYLANPETKLVLKWHIRISGGGRLSQPKPPLFSTIKPEMSDIDSWYPK